MPRLTAVRMDESRRGDFYAVHCDRNDTGWCNCIAWWVPTWEGWDQRSAEGNRALRDSLFDRGEHDGYLLYADDVPVGWAQVGPRDRLAKLTAQFSLEPDPETWGITCFVVIPEHRRRGYARKLLDAILDDLRARGVRRVEAYPKRGDDLDPLDLWTGPETIYREAGFQTVAETPRTSIMAISL